MTPIQEHLSKLDTIQDKRQFLKTISADLKALVKEEIYPTLNAAIIATIYQPEGHQVLKTYEQWKKEGKQVKKGEKAFIVWGSPKFKEVENQEGEGAEPFYPICFLFSNLQVE